MDAFEQLVSEILWMDGYWVRTSVKVELTKEEKRLIGRPSSPRWELDIVAYNGRDNLLRVVECKSYLDSLGVQAKGFDAASDNSARYKLFNDPMLRDVVFEQGWDLWDEAWLRERLARMAAKGYENQVSAVVSKLLLRGALSNSKEV